MLTTIAPPPCSDDESAPARCLGPTICALVRADLATGECQLRERAESLEADLLWASLALQQAVAAMHLLTRQRDQSRQQCAALRDQVRELLGIPGSSQADAA